MEARYIYRINDQNPRLPEQAPVNRIIYSSFHRFETEVVSRGLSLKVPLEGEEKYLLDHDVHKVNPGEYLLTQNGQMVGYDLNKKTPVKGLCIYLDEDLIKKALASGRKSHLYQLDNPDIPLSSISILQGKYVFEPGRLSNLVDFIKTETLAPTCTTPINEVFYEVALELSNQWMEDQQRISSLDVIKKSTKVEIYLRLQKSRQFIHDECARPLSIKEIAAAGYFSEFHFIRCFKLCYGCSPYQYLLRVRVEKAKEMLFSGKYSVGEVALKAGFNDVFMFSKTFKKLTGVSPSLFTPSLSA